MIKCPFCPFESPLLHEVSNHMVKEHLGKVETDGEGDCWREMKVKEVK